MSGAPKRPAKRRTPEEIQAQREAWLARKQAREAGLPVDEEPAPEAEAAAPVAEAEVEPPAAAAPATVEPEPETQVAEPAPAKAEVPASPSKRRSPEEIKAQREAMLAKREAKAAAKAAATKETPPPQPTAKKAPAKKAATSAKKKAAKKKNTFDRPANVTRREFLNLAWLGSIALLTVQTLGVSVLFLFPRFKEGDFGGIIPVGQASAKLPEVGGSPVPFASGKFWLTNTPEGAFAIYQVCTHLGCLYAWSDVTSRFECPCHGSKFDLSGTFIEGPAPRSLDRFKLIAESPDGTIKETPDSGGPLALNGDEILKVDTGARILLDGKVDASTLS